MNGVLSGSGKSNHNVFERINRGGSSLTYTTSCMLVIVIVVVVVIVAVRLTIETPIFHPPRLQTSDNVSKRRTKYFRIFVLYGLSFK